MILFVVFCTMGARLEGSGQEVSVRIQLPPAGRFTTEDLFHAVHLTHAGLEPLPLSLHATVLRGGGEALIFEGETPVFEVSPGTVIVGPGQVESLHVLFSDPGYEGLLFQTGSVPAGSYLICVEVLGGETGELLSKDCVMHEVSHPSPPQLLMPANEATVTEEFPIFSWLPPMPADPGVMLYYRLRITELLDGQNPLEAMEANPAWFLGEEIAGVQLVYPVDARPLSSGSYVWQVQALTEQGIPVGSNDGRSEPFIFYARQVGGRHIRVLTPVASCVGSVPEQAFLGGGLMNVQWEYAGPFRHFEVVVYENPCGRYPVPPSTPTPPPGGPTPPPGGRTPPGKPPVITGPGPAERPVTPGPETPVTARPPAATGETPVTGRPDTGDDALPATPVTEGEDLGGEEGLPPLPPGWKWGPGGPYWTGEHPPEPPALPPGWEWGPLRPVWTGEGEPPPRVILGTSEQVAAVPPMPGENHTVYENMTLDVTSFVQPGEAFIYQIYGSGEEAGGTPFALLSEPQCLRYMPVGADGEAPQPAPCPDALICKIRIEEKVEPLMDGGLDPPVQNHTLYRDEFVPLKADGKDFDQLWWHCEPVVPCPDSPSSEMRSLTGRVRYKWEITQGEGSLVDLGCLTAKKNSDGNRTIFMPPYVEVDSVRETEIKLTILDDNPTQPRDSDVVRLIRIKTLRTRTDPDRYAIQIKSDPYRLPQPVQLTGLPLGTCRCRGPQWTMDKDLGNPPAIKLPPVADNNKLVYKEWIRLEASDARDPDQVKVFCQSQKCRPDNATRTYEDEVEWSWKILSGGGRFVTGDHGRFVIYEAPETAGEVEIAVEAFNNSPLQITDQKSPQGKIRLKVFQPGVKLELTPLAWLPEPRRELQKKSYLQHKEGDEWKPPFDHQCRIHFLEWTSCSTEKGICLNWPPPGKADQCPDMAFKKEGPYEAYDTLRCRKNNTTDTLYYRKARSKVPEKEMTVTVVCEDYGAYGFVRSLANGTKSAANPCLSVPWKKPEVPHPGGREKKNEFADNRVTVPRDCDENRIADNGWTTRLQNLINPAIAALGGRAMKENDPVDPLIDTDRKPVSNNDGDGLAAYEEYRGFRVKGQHHRTGTGQKDLFIHDRNNIGLGDFLKTGIMVHRINRNEFTRARVINFNHGAAGLTWQGFEQHGLLLVDASAEAAMNNLYGIALGGPGPPGVIDSVKINVTLNNNNGRPLGRSIAHELSHAVDVWHHGSSWIYGFLQPNDTLFIDADTIVNTTAENFEYSIACKKGVHSGDVDCWMRYTHRYCPVTQALKDLDCSVNGWNANLSGRLLTRQNYVYGNNITATVAGTGVNAGGNCGQDAANNPVGSHANNRAGACTLQIKIRDR